jgi:hypothetical protein
MPVYLTDAQNTFAILSFFGAMAFAIWYSVRADWWTYRVGRAMVSLDVAVILTLFPSLLHLMFHVNTTTLFYGWWRATALCIVFCTILWRIYTVDYVQRHTIPDNGTRPVEGAPIPEKEEVE